MFFEILSFVILLLIFWFLLQKWKRLSQPPGPFPFPLLGNLPQLAIADPVSYIGIDKLARKYGDVMSLKLGMKDAVIISSLEAAKDILTKEETLGRSADGLFWDRNLKQNIGLSFSNGEAWIEIRKFCLDSLRNYGFLVRESMENLIVDELDELVKYIDEDRIRSPNGCIKFSSDYLQMSFANLTGTMLLGKRFGYNDEELLELLRHSHDFVRNGALSAGLLMAFPFLKDIFPEYLSYNTQMKAMYGLYDCAVKLLDKRRKEDYRHNPRCFTDDFLNKIDEDAKKPNPFYTVDNFKVIFADLFQGGSDTSSNSALFGLLLLTAFPQVQEKLYEEITNVCGLDMRPRLEQRQIMVYTQAVILEVLRWSRVLVSGVPKKALKDFRYRDYTIKEDTVIIVNYQTLFFSEKYWTDPNVFRPERFIDQNGKLIQSEADKIITFGLGKRNCFGEPLARDSMFMYITTLFQTFQFKLPPGVTPNLEPTLGITLGPHPFEAIVSLRHPEYNHL